MLTIIYFIFIILVVIGLFIFGKKLPFLSSKITLTILLIFLIIISFFFFRVIQKINNKSYLPEYQNTSDFSNNLGNDTENYKNKFIIYVGTTAKLAPWSYESKGVISGFNVELAKEAVRLMAKKINVKTYPNVNKMYEALDKKEIDIIIDLESIDNSANKYAYSISLVDAPLVFIGNSNSLTKSINTEKANLPTILYNKTIAVVDIPRLTNSLNSYVTDISNIKILNDNNEVLSSVSKGKYNFGYIDYYSFLYYKSHNPKSNLVVLSSLLSNKQNRAQAFVLNSSDIELRNQLNIALSVLKRRGDISNLSIKYFNEDVTL